MSSSQVDDDKDSYVDPSSSLEDWIERVSPNQFLEKSFKSLLSYYSEEGLEVKKESWNKILNEVGDAKSANEITDNVMEAGCEISMSIAVKLMKVIPKNESKDYQEKLLRKLVMTTTNNYEKAKYSTDLALILQEQGLLEEAKPVFEQSLQILKETHGDMSIEVAMPHTNLGILLQEQGQLDDAKVHLENALQIYETEHHGDKIDHQDVAASYKNMAMLFEDQGQFDEAISFFEKSLDINKKIYNDIDHNHPEVALAYANLGMSLQQQGRLNEAKSNLEKSLQIRQEIYGDEDHPDLARAYNNIAMLLEKQDQSDEAQEFYEKSIRMNEKLYDKGNLELALSYNNLAMLLRDQDKLEEAKALLEKSLQMCIKCYDNNEEHPQLVGLYYCLGDVYQNLGQNDEAEDLFDKAERIEATLD